MLIYFVLISLRLTWRWKRLISLSIYHPREHQTNTEATHTITQNMKMLRQDENIVCHYGRTGKYCGGDNSKMKISFTVTAGQENTAVETMARWKYRSPLRQDTKNKAVTARKSAGCVLEQEVTVFRMKGEKGTRKDPAAYIHIWLITNTPVLQTSTVYTCVLTTSNISWWISKCSWKQSRLTVISYSEKQKLMKLPYNVQLTHCLAFLHLFFSSPSLFPLSQLD